MDSWTIWASSGEYTVQAPDIMAAYTAFVAKYGNDNWVTAITCDGMEPRLVLEEKA